jgi:hypothetical protein
MPIAKECDAGERAKETPAGDTPRRDDENAFKSACARELRVEHDRELRIGDRDTFVRTAAAVDIHVRAPE